MDALIREALAHYQITLRQQFLQGKERKPENQPSLDWCWNMGEKYGRIAEMLNQTRERE